MLASAALGQAALGQLAVEEIVTPITNGDTGAGLDDQLTLTAALTTPETGTGDDAVATLDTGGGIVAKSDADTGSGIDEEGQYPGYNEGYEGGPIIVAFLSPQDDTATAADTESVNIPGGTTPADADTGAGADAELTLVATLTDTDTATADDAGTAGVPLSSADTGSGADTETAPFVVTTDTKSDGDTAAGSESTGTIVEVFPDMVFVFTPGGRDEVPPIMPDTREGTTRLANKLFRFYRERPHGIAVWHLIDDTFTEDQPYPTFPDTKQTREQMAPNNDIEPTYKVLYYGGHSYTVDDDEAALIQAALDNGDITGSLEEVEV